MGTESKNTEDASSERKELRKKKMRDEGRYCRCVGAAYPQPRTLDRMGGGGGEEKRKLTKHAAFLASEKQRSG